MVLIQRFTSVEIVPKEKLGMVFLVLSVQAHGSAAFSMVVVALSFH